MVPGGQREEVVVAHFLDEEFTGGNRLLRGFETRAKQAATVYQTVI